MTHMSPKSENLEIVLGEGITQSAPITFEPFNSLVLEFLSCLSTEVLKDLELSDFPDIAAFAFFIREGNLLRLAKKHDIREFRRGRGWVFHIAPSNVPLNFAYSLTFSLLAGNSNIVRLPSKEYYQVSAICSAIRRIIQNPKYSQLAYMINLVKYGHNEEITKAISDISSVRIVWGGDETIKKIREIPLPLSSFDIGFINKYSAAVISSEQILCSEPEKLNKLAANFYSDAYLFDQHGCSSPKLVIWCGKDSEIQQAQEIFWGKVESIVEAKYDLQQIHAVDKFVDMCQLSIKDSDIVLIKNSNYLYRISVPQTSGLIGSYQGSNGVFLESSVSSILDIPNMMGENFQTLTYFGFEKHQFESVIFNLKNQGLDRIVPIGQAFNMETIWDGMDLIRTLSRVIDLR